MRPITAPGICPAATSRLSASPRRRSRTEERPTLSGSTRAMTGRVMANLKQVPKGEHSGEGRRLKMAGAPQTPHAHEVAHTKVPQDGPREGSAEGARRMNERSC